MVRVLVKEENKDHDGVVRTVRCCMGNHERDAR